MYATIESVNIGDIIVEGRSETTVSKVEVHACSSKGTHINSRDCYERGSVVQLKQGAKSRKDDTGTFDDLDDIELNPHAIV